MESKALVKSTKTYEFILRRKMEQILLAYSLPKETVAAIMILYRNTNVKVRSPDGDWTQVSRTIGEHSTHCLNKVICYQLLIFNTI